MSSEKKVPGKLPEDTKPKMAAKRVVMGTRRMRPKEMAPHVEPQESSLEELREVNTRLRATVETANCQIKQLRREKAVELREVTEREQHKANITLKEVRLRMMQEKTADLEKQKDNLNKRYETEIAKTYRKHETEVNKLQDALAKSQAELSRSKVKNNGLSGGRARVNAFEGEKAKLMCEVQELRTNKKKLELALKDNERQHRTDLEKATQGHTSEIQKIKRDNESELRKLTEEVKCRERQVASLERDLTSQVNETQRLRKEKEHATHALHEAEENVKKMARKVSMTSSTLGDGSASTDNPPGENGIDRSEAVLRRQIADMTSQMKRFEEQCASLKQEKADLVRKVAEVEKRHRPLTDKARRFLEKNIELTSINRSLEEKIKTLHDDNIALRSQTEKEREVTAELNSRLEEQQSDHDVITNLQMEIENLQQQIIEQDKNVYALKLACSEKDRRIELLCHRRRKQRAVKAQQKTVRFLLVPNGTVMAAGIKETYYGYDEDRSSVESELSTSSRLSSSRLSLDNTFDEDDMFDEFTREEFHRNYQRLAKEHMELEKSFALLQNQGALSHVDPQRELKLRSQLENDLLSAQSRIEDLTQMVKQEGQDVSWLDEKEKLNNNIKTLKEKISQQESSINDLKVSLQESQEQNEELEFRCLELEENNKKLSEDARSSLTYKGPVTLTAEGVLELYAEEEGLVEVKVETLKTNLLQYTETLDGHFSREEQVVLLQTYALLNIADQKLKEQQTVEKELREKFKHLEAEKAVLDEAGVTKELGVEHKEVKAKLEAAELLVKKLEEEVSELRRQDAIHKYTEDFNTKTEERYKEEVTSLRRQLSTSQEGRGYESELLQAKLHELKSLEQRVSQLELENKDLQSDLERSRGQARDLEERIVMEQETQALTESDKDASTLLHNLRTRVKEQEKSEQEVSEKNTKLQTEVTTLRARLTEYENIEAELTEKTFTLQQDAESYKQKYRTMEDDLTTTRSELRNLQTQVSRDSVQSLRRDPDTVSMASLGSMSEADLSEDNQSLRVELFSLREQIKMLEQENERFMRNAGGADVQSRIKALEKEMMDLKHENVTLKERLKDKMKELDTVEEELGSQIRNKKAKIKSLEEEMEQARNDAVSMETMIVEMKKEMFASQEKLDLLEEGDKEKNLLELTSKVKDMEVQEEGLQEELEILSASHAVLKGNAESLLRREEEYDIQISELHAELKQKNNLIATLEITQETLTEEKAELEAQLNSSSTTPKVNSEVTAMEDKVKALEKDLQEAHQHQRHAEAKLETAISEKDLRIKFLQEQLDKMEVSEGHLNASLTDVEQLEGQLRQQLEMSGTGSTMGSSTSGGQSYELELTQLRSSQERLLTRIDELEETEKSLRVELDNKERKTSENDEVFKTDSMSESGDKLKQYQERCDDLEARVKELSRHESDLMEQIYVMQLENQELQEHIDLLQEASDHEAEEEDDVTAHVTKTETKTVSSSSSATKQTEVKADNKTAADRLAKIEAENEDLKEQLLKAKLDAIGTSKGEMDPTTIVDAARVASLESQVKDLQKHEEELIAEVENLQTAEKKLSKLHEHVHELEGEIEEHIANERSLKDKVDLLEQSKEKLVEDIEIISVSEGKLKDEVNTLKLASSSGQQVLLDKIRVLEEKEKDLKEEIEDLKHQRSDLKEKLDEARNSEESEVKRLQEKVDLLLDSEENLIDKFQEQNALEQQLRQKLSESEAEVGELKVKVKSSEDEIAELRSQIDQLTESEKEIILLKEQLQKANTQGEEREQNIMEKEKIVAELENSLQTKDKDIKLEREKVSLFELEIAKLITKLKSSEKEISTLNDQLSSTESESKKLTDEVSKMKEVEGEKKNIEKEKDEYKHQINDLTSQITLLEVQLKDSNREREQLQDKLTKMDALDIALSEAKTENRGLLIKTEVLENNEKALKERINELEKSEAVLHTKVVDLERRVSDLRVTEDSLRQQISDFQTNEGALTARIVNLEKDEVKLKTQVTDLEVQNAGLMSNIRQSPVTVVKEVPVLKEVPVETTRRSPSPTRLTPILRSRSPSPRPWDDLSDLHQLEGMSREELISKVHELQTMERFHRKRLRELSTNLSQFRQAVETVTVTMETDTDVPVMSNKSKFKDSEYEAKVTEMVRTEVNLKMKVNHLQKELISLRTELSAAEEQIREMEQNFHTEMEELEEELDESRKAEARIKNKLQYGQIGQENQALAKIQHLETLVFDLEAAERKLQRRVNDLESNELRLKDKLILAEEKAKTITEIPVNPEDQHYDIIQQVMLMDASGKELTEKLTNLNKEDARELKKRIMDLERSEKGLKREVEMLKMNQEVARVTIAEEVLDSPEAILKKRVRELEKLEEHNKKQLMELEKDREELSEITRHDKNTIHELNVNIRELELLQRNLKDQITHHEVQESRHVLTIDDLTERLEDLQNKIHKMESAEKQLKLSLGEHRSSKEDIARELENVTEDWKQDEQKFKRKLSDLEIEKRMLTDKVDELADRVGDLEGVEISLKSRIKVLENSEMELKNTVLEFEHSEGEAKSRMLELETLNETLSQKLHDMEEEKTNIMYEMTELQTTKDTLKNELQHLMSSNEHLKARMMEFEGSEAGFMSRIEESAEREAVMMAKVAEYERHERKLQEKISNMEENESKLRLTVQTLESSVSMANSRVQSSQDVDKENTSLREELHNMRDANATLTDRKRHLQEKLELYEYAHADKDIATLPRSELSQLRMQVQLLAETEATNAQLEKSERNLKQTIDKLRQGKDVCGHEAEIKDLKDELNRLQTVAQERDGLKRALTSTKKAHELLKENHEATKMELSQALKSSSVKVRPEGQGHSSSKAVQARLSQSYKLTDVSPELRNALKGLGAKYPDAYQDFVRTLQPSQVAMATKRKQRQHQQPEIDAVVIPTNVAMTAAAPPSEQNKSEALSESTSTLFTVTKDTKPDDTKVTAISDLVSLLPMTDLQIADPASQGQVRVREGSRSPIEEESLHELWETRYLTSGGQVLPPRGWRQSYSVVEEFVEPEDSEGERLSKVSITSEDPLWATIERHRAGRLDSGNEREESYWANIENTTGDLDDMTLCVTFPDDAMSRSTSSIQSDVSERSAPPLPTTLPPPQLVISGRDAFYHHDDSADEASEIVDEDDVVGVMMTQRARSVERDSDFSESIPLGSSPQQFRRRKLGQNTSSLDSIADSGMGTLRQSDIDFLRERIATLEKQLKDKEKELELARINQRDLERKARDAEDASLLKVKLEERERELDLERHRVTDLRNELSELQRQLEDRQTDIRRLKADVDRLHNSLKAAPNSTDAESTESYLKEQIERKEEEINAKSNEVDRLIEELRKTQDESRVAKDSYQEALNAMSALKLDLEMKTDLAANNAQLEQDHAALKKEHDDLVNRYEQFTQASEEKSALEKIILKLRGQLKDLERIDLERQDLEKRSKVMESDLRLSKANESELTQEVATLQRQRDELKQEVEHMTSTHEDYSKVITKYDNMEQVTKKAELMVTPLRAKVIRLSQKCKEKDNLIERLAGELSRSGEPSELLSEADRVKKLAASDEYNRPITPLHSQIFEDEEAVIRTNQSGTFSQPRHRTTSGGSSAGSSSADSLLDDDNDRYHDNKKRSTSGRRGKADGKVTAVLHGDHHVNNGSRGFTIDDIVTPSGISLQPVTSLHTGSGPETYTWPRKKVAATVMQRAVKDYDPELFSQSGKKDKELPLKEGQEVRIIGGLDSHGYYEAEVEGRVGLVPANYLQPVNPDRHSKHHRHPKPVARHGSTSSPDQILAFHEQLQNVHVPNHKVPSSRPSSMGRMNTIVHPAFIRRPVPPPGVRSTTMPRPRHARHSIATQRQAAALATANQLNIPGSLRHSTHSLPDNQGHQATSHMTNGLQSPPPIDNKQAINMATVQAPPEPPSNFKIERVVGEDAVLLSWQPPTLDEMARSNGTTVTGYTIYINNRDKQKIPSPHMPKALIERLNLRRPNRFSIQSIGSNGQRSRVVDVLFEDVLPELAGGDRLTTDSDNNSSVLSSSGQHSDGERRVFMAVYDYNPATHSPNVFPSGELSLHAGDLVTVHGGVNAEGFYRATMNGKTGLVPASFIEEVSLLRSHSRRSLSGSSQGSHPNSRSNSQPNSRHGSRPSSIHGSLPKVAAPV